MARKRGTWYLRSPSGSQWVSGVSRSARRHILEGHSHSPGNVFRAEAVLETWLASEILGYARGSTVGTVPGDQYQFLRGRAFAEQYCNPQRPMTVSDQVVT
jgi:hypothetical protein